MNTVAKICLIFCGFLLFNSNQIIAQTDDSPSPLTKTTDGKTYTNEFFKLSVVKPNGWYAPTSEELLAAQKYTSNLLAGDNKTYKAILDTSLNSTITIFSFSEFPPGTPDKRNPGVSAVAENIKAFPGIKNGCDYLALSKETFKQSQIPIKFEDKCESRILNGTEFKMGNAQISLGNQLVKQRYFLLVKDGYAIGVSLTYSDPQSEAKLNQIVNTIKIKL